MERILRAIESISLEEIRESFSHLRQLEKRVEYGGGIFEK